MTLIGWTQILFYFFVLVMLVKPIGSYMAQVLAGNATIFSKIIRPVENCIYRVCGIDPSEEMNWKTYTGSLLIFHFCGILFLYAILRLQAFFYCLKSKNSNSF